MNSKTSGFRRLRSAALLGLAVAAVAAPSAAAGNYIAGYTDFPNALRVADARLQQQSSYIAGYTDFPNALRVADARLQQQSSYIPGYTDFPNALRVADARGTGSAIARPTVSPAQSSPSTFNWSDAGIGAGATLGAGLLLLGTGVALRSRIRTVRTH
jgi:hypothetical protein